MPGFDLIRVRNICTVVEHKKPQTNIELILNALSYCIYFASTRSNKITVLMYGILVKLLT